MSSPPGAAGRALPPGPPSRPTATGAGDRPSSSHLLAFVDEFAPVWTDPLTGITKPMTHAGWVAAGFEVAGPTAQGYWVVNLDSRRTAIEAPVPGREYAVDPRRGHDTPPDGTPPDPV